MIQSFTFFLGSVLLSQDVCVAHISMRTKAMLCVLWIWLSENQHIKASWGKLQKERKQTLKTKITLTQHPTHHYVSLGILPHCINIYLKALGIAVVISLFIYYYFLNKIIDYEKTGAKEGIIQILGGGHPPPPLVAPLLTNLAFTMPHNQWVFHN